MHNLWFDPTGARIHDLSHSFYLIYYKGTFYFYCRRFWRIAYGKTQWAANWKDSFTVDIQTVKVCSNSLRFIIPWNWNNPMWLSREHPEYYVSMSAKVETEQVECNASRHKNCTREEWYSYPHIVQGKHASMSSPSLT